MWPSRQTEEERYLTYRVTGMSRSEKVMSSYQVDGKQAGQGELAARIQQAATRR